MNVLVTGAGGFIGSYLIDYFVEGGANVDGVLRESSSRKPGSKHSFKEIHLDLTESQKIREIVERKKYDSIFHLAAQSIPKKSWSDPQSTFTVNLGITISFLEALRINKSEALFINVGSSSEYIMNKDSSIIIEDDALMPLHPYGVSKMAAEIMALLYEKTLGLNIISVRPFFIIGPGKEGDVCSDFCRRIVEIEKGGKPILKTGNLETVRDFLDVRDAVKALDLISKKGKIGEVYNISSGKGNSIKDILNIIKKNSNIKICEEVDPSLMRKNDEPIRIGSNQKLQELGWRQDFSLEQTLKDILLYWRSYKNN